MRCIPVPVYVLEGAAMGRVCKVGLVQFGEELQGREFFQMEGRLCNQPLEASKDGVRQGAESCVGDVPAGTSTHKWGLNTIVTESGILIWYFNSCHATDILCLLYVISIRPMISKGYFL